MNSDIIFQYSESSSNRYSLNHGRKLTVYADFSDPSEWPYRVKFETWDSSAYDDSQAREEHEVNIPADTFDEINRMIVINEFMIAYAEESLISCHTSNNHRESFYFACDEYTKNIKGVYILPQGKQDIENDNVDSDYARIYALVQQINHTLNAVDVNFITI